MNIIIKNEDEIEKIKIAGGIVSNLLYDLSSFIKEGITTKKIDNICLEYIKDNNAIPALLNYHGFPASICTSINHQVCHGIPGNRLLRSGDILNVDVTIGKDGYYADSSKMFLIGKCSAIAKKITKVSQECLYKGIKKVKSGNKINSIGIEIEKFAEKMMFSVVREYCGHGIGKNIHEEPNILHYNAKNNDYEMKPGMVFTIEPMINQGTFKVKLLKDGWSVVTEDGKLSAQWEHTVLVKEDGYEVLTLRKDENIY